MCSLVQKVLTKFQIICLDLKFDDNFVPLTIRFAADRPGSFATSIDMYSDSDDIRTIPIEFKVTESSLSESTTAFLEFNTSVFETTVQQIPIVR